MNVPNTTNRKNDNDDRRPKRDSDEDSPIGANEFGVQNGSGGGVNSVNIVGAGQPVNNFSQVSTGEIAVKGPTNLEGPESAGTFQAITPSKEDDDGIFHSLFPVILDLNDNGIEITELSKSTVFMDASGNGLQNRTAWAVAGDGVLFYDPDGHNSNPKTFSTWRNSPLVCTQGRKGLCQFAVRKTLLATTQSMET